MATPTVKEITTSNPAIDFIHKLAQVPGVEKLKGILEGVNLGLGGTASADAHSQADITGDVNVQSSGLFPWYVWVGGAIAAFIYWRNK